MIFHDASVDWLCALLARTAEAEILPRFRRLSETDIRQKTSTVDLVTEADISAERVITAALRQRYPAALIVGEEAQAERPEIMDGLGGAELAFVLDPVDGTLNFASGLPLFGVMLAVVVNGETVVGIIHDPIGKDTLVAVKGAGSHVRRTDGQMERCRAAQPVPLSEMRGHISWQFLADPERSRVARNQAKVRGPFSLRCAAHEYRLLATGHAHFVGFMKVMPWDHLPGALILSEAGGHVAMLDGSPYRPGVVGGGLLAASDADSWQVVREAMWAD